MNQRAKRAVLSALTTVLAAGALTVATTPQASAIDQVPCSSNEFLQIDVHPSSGNNQRACFANAGRVNFNGDWWITRIWTGNNRVQWHGDGRWQPAAPIDKWTVFTWPNHPAGVRIDALNIP